MDGLANPIFTTSPFAISYHALLWISDLQIFNIFKKSIRFHDYLRRTYNAMKKQPVPTKGDSRSPTRLIFQQKPPKPVRSLWIGLDGSRGYCRANVDVHTVVSLRWTKFKMARIRRGKHGHLHTEDTVAETAEIAIAKYELYRSTQFASWRIRNSETPRITHWCLYLSNHIASYLVSVENSRSQFSQISARANHQQDDHKHTRKVKNGAHIQGLDYMYFSVIESEQEACNTVVTS